MRINIVGENESCQVLSGYLVKAGYVVSKTLSDYTIYLSYTDIMSKHVILDGVDSELERHVLNNLEELGIEVFTLQRAKGIRSDRSISVQFNPEDKYIVEKGIFRALLMEMGNAMNKIKSPTISKKVKTIGAVVTSLLALLFLASKVHGEEYSIRPALYMLYQPAPSFPIIRFWDGTVPVNGGDSGNNALRVNCIVGCTAGGSFADSSAFTFGTTAISNAGFVVDDTATNTVAENSAGAGRMSTNRIPYFSLHFDTGTAAGNTGTSLNVNCTGGCAGSSFADNSAFTFGTTTISNTGFVVDDTATNVVTENSAGAPRMSTNRIPYFSPHYDSGSTLLGQQTMTLSLPVVIANNQSTVNVNTFANQVPTPNNDGACVSVTTSSTTVLASFATRKAFSLFARETNTAIVFIKMAATATSSDFPLPPGSAYNMTSTTVYTGIIDGISASGTQSVCVVEF